jgi:hypothetical protein
MTEPSPPHDRLGVFKQFEDVPARRRLRQFSNVYEGRDVWSDYRATADLSARMGEEWDLFARRWKEHMNSRGRHHALAHPDDVEAWSAWLLDQFRVDRSYQHWNVIEGFYAWLMWHTAHRHTYNPFHLAATDTTSQTYTIWSRKLEKV